jgi:hypothetical protein
MTIIVFELRAPGGIVNDESGSPGTGRDPPSLAEMHFQLTPSPDAILGIDPQELVPEMRSSQPESATESATTISAEEVNLFIVRIMAWPV